MRHVGGIVDVKRQLTPTVHERSSLDPGTDLDGLGVVGFLTVSFLALVLLAQQI